MKRTLFIILCALLYVSAYAQEASTAKVGVIVPEYELYPTQNNWTFLELESSTGRVWQVQYSIKGDDYRFKVSLNPNSLLPYGVVPTPGRFKLSATTNIYNFLLLDTCTGRVWQIQWSLKSENRGIVDYIEEIDPSQLDKKTGASHFTNFKTIVGTHEIVQIIPPSPTYDYYVVELSSEKKAPKRRDVSLLMDDGKKVSPVEKFGGNKFVFRPKDFHPCKMIISGEDPGEIEIY